MAKSNAEVASTSGLELLRRLQQDTATYRRQVSKAEPVLLQLCATNYPGAGECDADLYDALERVEALSGSLGRLLTAEGDGPRWAWSFYVDHLDMTTDRALVEAADNGEAAVRDLITEIDRRRATGATV